MTNLYNSEDDLGDFFNSSDNYVPDYDESTFSENSDKSQNYTVLSKNLVKSYFCRSPR